MGREECEGPGGFCMVSWYLRNGMAKGPVTGASGTYRWTYTLFCVWHVCLIFLKKMVGQKSLRPFEFI